MKHSFKSDFALFTAAFVAAVTVLGADTSFADIVNLLAHAGVTDTLTVLVG